MFMCSPKPENDTLSIRRLSLPPLASPSSGDVESRSRGRLPSHAPSPDRNQRVLKKGKTRSVSSNNPKSRLSSSRHLVDLAATPSARSYHRQFQSETLRGTPTQSTRAYQPRSRKRRESKEKKREKEEEMPPAPD